MKPKPESHYEDLLSRMIDRTLSGEELEELLDFIEADPQAYERLTQTTAIRHKLELAAERPLPEINAALKERGITKLLSAIDQTEQPVKIHRIGWIRWAAAAVFIGIGTFYFVKNSRPATTEPVGQTKSNVITPGSNRATLTLADNATIVLDSAANGTLATQGSTRITKLTNGQLAYNTTEKPSTEILYNTLTVPRGGQYQLTLPDGTRVWLNAASSITYPTSFTASNRKVTLTGEAYFEVRHNAAAPFTVQVGAMDVNDIGTAFNINAYSDESTIKTTLLEGKVSIRKNSQIKLLAPGQQAQVTNQSDQIEIKKVDTEESVSWKEGFFHFKGANIRSVMRELSRWYDIDVEFVNKPSDLLYGGDIRRNLNLSEVLEVLKSNDVHFKIEDRKIIVE